MCILSGGIPCIGQMGATVGQPMSAGSNTTGSSVSPTYNAYYGSAALEQGLLDLGISRDAYALPKQLWLASKDGRGLEIQGTCKHAVLFRTQRWCYFLWMWCKCDDACLSLVARRQGGIFMEMIFTNRALEQLYGFALLLNKNT